MAFKQPRVPEYRESEGTGKYIRSLVLFLKDFCMDVWTANNQRTGEIDAVRGGLSEIHYPVSSVCGKTGEVALSADDVGARPDDWTPTASDVGALGAEGTAVNAGKLDGKTWAQVLDAIYPVGAVYLSAASTSPASLFGGTWEQIKDCFLLGAGDAYSAGSTGGAATETLTQAQLPAVTGAVIAGSGNTGASAGGYGAFRSASGVFSVANVRQYCGNGSGGTWPSGDTYERFTMSFGSGQAHNNMPPYLAVHMWKRVS